ncbi:MAG: RHS repeat protein [Planctomycetes bacterium]|nr:RHS repeat protein [Planctomycetota bacterium]
MKPSLQRALPVLLLLGAAVAAAAQERAPGAPDADRAPEERRDGEPQDREKPTISDLTDPMRTLRPATGSTRKATAADDLLRLVPGRGGDVLAGLVESEQDLSPDLRLLLDFLRDPTNDARQRAVAAPPAEMKPFLLFNTAGIPLWGEQEQRDAFGRITSMADALGNRTHFRYDARGLAGVEAEPIGPLNLRWGDSGRLVQENPQRGGLEERPIFDNVPQEFRAARAPFLTASPYSLVTEQRVHPDGGHSFTVYDLMGRPVYTYDARGNLTLNRYGPGGQLMGTYDAQGRLTLYGHDALGRRNFAVDSQGNRILVDHDRQGSGVLGTADGEAVKVGGSYVPARPVDPVEGTAPAGATRPRSQPARTGD